MLHIILLILKIIGIVLLCILGVLFLAIGCALFVPLRYRIEVYREEGEDNPPVTARVKVTWLLHLVNILICYPSDVYVRARIFLFTLFRFPESKKEKKSNRKKRKEAGEQDSRPAEKEEVVSRPAEPQDGNLICGDDRKQDEQREPDTHTEEAGAVQEPSGFLNKIIKRIHDLTGKIKQIIDKMKNAVENMQYTIRRFCDKIKSALDNIQYYREVLESDSFKHSWALCRKQAGIILKELKPDKVEADVIVGTEDPATTGEILAICGMLYPWIGQHVRVVGDFERAHIEGRIFIKGKLRAFTFLRVAVKVYLNKDIKALIKLFKKEAV